MLSLMIHAVEKLGRLEPFVASVARDKFDFGQQTKADVEGT